MANRKFQVNALPSHASTQQDLVYGDALESLVFIPRQRAEDFAASRHLLDSEPTWGQFREAASSELVKETESWYKRKDRPADDEGFSPPYLIAEEWPFFHQEQSELLPRDVKELGTVVSTTLSGDRLDFPSSAEKEVVRRLRLHGFKVERNDSLIRRASGIRDD